MSWSATSPSNIALIKYMGKADKNLTESFSFLSKEQEKNFTSRLSKKDREDFYFKNLSLNSSLSYTLNHFVTTVQIEESDKDNWSPFKKNSFQNNRFYSSSKEIHFENKISDQAQKKFLNFFQFLKRFFLISGNYTVYSQNNFPIATGSASSASSFSALTLATYELAKNRSSIKDKIRNLQAKDLAMLSRVGSGSSCRSFFSPWCIWSNREISTFQTDWSFLLHQLIIVESKPKQISSTKAHQMVKTSPHFKDRSERVSKRMNSLCEALNLRDWESCFKICYEEFLDLHSLFETANPPFEYKNTLSQQALNRIKDYWKTEGDGPLVTMDAGANIHLLYRPDQYKQREKITSLLSDYAVLSSLEQRNNYKQHISSV